MVVDDSIVVRGLVSRWIEDEPDLVLAGSLRTGRQAVDLFERSNPDVVVLDVDMPELDGMTALPLLLEKRRDLVVIMASTLTRRNAEISLRALSLGAADYIPKPENNRAILTSTTFRRELIEKIRALGSRRKPAARKREPSFGALSRGAFAPARTAEDRADARPAGLSGPFRLKPFSHVRPRVLLIGSSTGGPQALTALVTRIAGTAERIPILIAQHMPPTFTTILADHLARASGRPVREAIDGEAIALGQIYIAPGGYHMRVVSPQGEPVIALDDGPLINFCKPAVDPLFQSAAAVWGSAVLAVVLTGMGSDGRAGTAAIADAGGSVIAQDEETSVVWGMPGAAVQTGLCSAVLPLEGIGPKIVQLLGGRP
jgi:two-component system chemotaxis response regulator CheB